MMQPSALSLKLGAERQCDWVDRKLDGVKQRAQKAQHDLLIAGSRQHLPRSGLMASQLPRGVQWGMALGRYPTTALRDVLIAVASVVVDDQIVEPLVRMGRRARLPRRAPGLEPDPTKPPRLLGHLYEDALVLMWGTVQAVLAAPLNAVVLGATLAGAGVGAVVGAVMAVVVGLSTPNHLLRHLCPSLAILTHLTSNCALTQVAAQARLQQQKYGQADNDEEMRKLWARINAQLLAHDQEIQALSPEQDGVQQARQLEQELLAVPTLSRFLGLGAYPLGNIDRLLAARATFDAEWAAFKAP